MDTILSEEWRRKPRRGVPAETAWRGSGAPGHHSHVKKLVPAEDHLVRAQTITKVVAQVLYPYYTQPAAQPTQSPERK